MYYKGWKHGDDIYADDITMVISAKTLEELRSEAAKNIGALRIVLRELSLELSDEKTRNLVFHPNLLPNGIHRRAPDLKYPNNCYPILLIDKGEGREKERRLFLY